ncbi:MAG TPA: hypothetical protein VMR21_17340 [Vicinamibacteria bacterium]|nr:hypothetical protein [Vicinamibacteria bacterium]
MIVASCGVRAALVSTHPLDPDELEHLHGGWCLAQGLWPYRDYFEHHTPWLHLLLAPLLGWLDVGADPDRAVASIFLARAAMWVVSTAAVVLTGRLALLWAGARAGWAAAALLAVTVAFVTKTAEVRPDGPAVLCLIGSWTACLAALRGEEGSRRTTGLLALSGLWLGSAVMFTQKALFAFPAAAALLAWWILAGRASRSTRARARDTIVFAAAVLAPIALTLLLFAFHGGVGTFVESNLLLNARWPVRRSPWPMIERIAIWNPLLAGLAAAGLVRAAIRLFTPGALARGDALVVLNTLGLAGGAFVIPVAMLQYFVMALPLAALLAASALVGGVEGAARLAGRGRPGAGPALGGPLLALALAAATVPPLLDLARRLDPARPRLLEQLARIRFVLAHTTPDDTVMDGFTGAGVFRPHAWFYFFLHEEIRALLGAPEIGRLRVALREGEIAPALLLFDDDLRQMHPEITSFLRENYEPTPDPVVWRRRDLALDGGRLAGRLELGDGPTDVLAGRGWGPPERDGLRTFRRTQGRRSALRVPLRAPSDVQVVVHALVLHGGPEGHLGLVVNGAPAGEHPLRGGWSDYTFEVPARAWRVGVNRVRLTRVPGEGAGAPSPDAEAGRQSVLAVDYLLLARGKAAPPP